MVFDVTLWGAFLAGLVSFVSPCVLPIVPPYLCYLAGISLDQLTGDDEAESGAAGRVFLAALAFVLGFSTVFVALGASATFVGRFITQYLDTLSVIAGIVILIMGVALSGDIQDFHALSRGQGAGAAQTGRVVRLIYHRPCLCFWLDPLASGRFWPQSSWSRAPRKASAGGAILLLSYSLGIGLPFLVAAVFAGPFMKFMTPFPTAHGNC